MSSQHICSACMILLAFTPATVLAVDNVLAEDSGPAKQSASSKSAVELSVPPLDQDTQYPSDRPDWVSSHSEVDGELPHRLIVASEPCVTSDQAEDLVKDLTRGAIQSYIDEITESIGRAEYYPVDHEWVENHLVTRTYRGKVTQNSETLHEHAVELTIDSESQRELLAVWKNVEVRDRLGALGVMVFIGLLMLILCSMILSSLCRRMERKSASLANAQGDHVLA